MKKRKIAKAALAVLSMLTIGAAGAAFAACDGDDDKHVHNYDKWILVTDPTLDTAGKAERYCKDNDGGKEETDVPKLTDTSVWTENLSVKVDPTCSATGKREFTSTDYGTVTVTLPVDSNVHSYGKWTLTKDPSKTETGVAVRVCGANGDHTDTKNDVPVLTDKSVWTLDEEKSEDATHTKAGKEVYTSIYGEVEVEIPANAAAHTWGKWEFVGDAPTLEKGGKIKHVCTEDNSHFEEQDVPALSNKDFWAETVTTPANHQNTGVADFKNAEYKIEVKNVTIPKVAHTFGAWTITTQPTLTAKGVATRVCSEIEGDCAEDATATETKELPELGDAFWTKSHANANYNSGSVDTYTNAEYGLEVKIVADDKKPAPYDDVQYYMIRCNLRDEGTIDFYARDNGTGGSVLDLVKNKGTAGMQPLMGEVTINSNNPDELNGEVEIVVKDSKGQVQSYPAYYDEATKIIVMVSSATDFYILTPYYTVKEIEVTVSDEDADEVVTEKRNANFANVDATYAYLPVGNDDVFAINYEYETDNYLGIFVENGVVTFNVTFKNEKGVLDDVSSANETYGVFYVHDKDDKKIAHYGVKYLGVDKDEQKIYAWAVCDGFEGVYQVSGVVNGVDVCGFVNGAGSLFYGQDKDNLVYDHPAYYEKINDNTIGAILEIQVGADEWQNIYYEFTMPEAEGGKVTAVAPKVTVTLNANGAGTVDPLEGISKNVPVKLPVLEDDAKQFMGWFTDADCKNPVVLDKDGKYKPVADAELYANWVNKRTLTLKIDANDAGTTIYFGEGEKLGKYLPELDVDEANWRSLVGWFVDIDGKQQVNADTKLPALDDLVIYGEWKALPVYYGEYSGASGTYDSEATVSIDKDGKVVGHTRWGTIKTTDFTATVQSYDPDTQELIWQVVREDESVKNVKVLFYASADHSTRVLLMDDNYYDDVDVMSTTYLVVAAGDSVDVSNDANIGINYNALGETATANRTRIIKYSVGAEDKLLFIYGDKLYANVTVENAFGDVLSHAEIKTSKTIVVKQNNKIVTTLGTTEAKLVGASSNSIKHLDAFYGVKSFDGVDYKFDGVGNIITDAKNYVYEIVDAATGKLDVFETDGEKNTVHYVMTVTDGNIVSNEKEMANLTMDGGTPISINTKIPYELTAPEKKSGYVFNGWHLLSDLSDDVITSITITEATEIYADWREEIAVTFNANGGKFEDEATSKELKTGKGMTLEIAEMPVSVDGATVFMGWFTDADCTEGNEWVSGETVVSEAITLYAKYDAVAISGTYKGWNLYKDGENGTKTISSLSSSLTINQNGQYSGAGITAGTLDSAYFATESGVISLGTYAYVDKSVGVIWYAYSGNNATSVGNDTYLLFNPEIVESIDFSGLKTKPYTFWAVVHFVDTSKSDVNIFGYNNEIYVGVSWGDIDVKNCYNTNHIIKKADNTELVALKDGKIVELDGKQGEYTSEGGVNLVIDGTGSFTWGDKVGTYAAKDGGGYDMYVKDGSKNVESYVLTLDTEAHTYSVVENKVTISYTTAHGEQASESVFVNVSHTLPAGLEAEGFIFRGWFDNAEYTGSAKTTVTPNETDTYAYFAKWDKAITVTVIYGNGMDQATLTEYYANDKITLALPAGEVEGKYAQAWHIGSLDGEVWTSGSELTDDTTLYCEWADPHVMQGSYKGAEVYGSTASGGSQSGGTSKFEITIDAIGKVTGSKTGTISNYDEVTGTFKLGDYAGVYNATDKIAVINWSSGGDALKNDVYICVRDINNHSSTGCYWDAGLTRLVQFTGNDGNPYIVFMYNNYVYGGVTFEAEKADGSAITDIKQVYSAQTVVVKKGDTVIAEFAKGTSGLVALDGYQGTYNGSANGVTKLVIDGIGNVTVNEEASKVKYAVADGKLSFAYNNRLYAVTFADGTFTQVQDGFAGTYALPDGAGNITLDGIGGAGDGKTYVVSGATLTVFDGDSTVAYGIDVENKVLSGKSIFAGLKFIHDSSSKDYIEFNDSTEISGKMSFNAESDHPSVYDGYIIFTGVLEGNTLTITVKSANGNPISVGKTLQFTVENGKLTLKSASNMNSYWQVRSGWVYDCADFSFAG